MARLPAHRRSFVLGWVLRGGLGFRVLFWLFILFFFVFLGGGGGGGVRGGGFRVQEVRGQGLGGFRGFRILGLGGLGFGAFGGVRACGVFVFWFCAEIPP